MKQLNFLALIGILFLISSCSPDSSLSDLEPSGESENNQAGLITAAEWHDLENWDFWNELLSEGSFSSMPGYWQFYNKHRISISLNDNDQAVVDVAVQLVRNEEIVWESKTDNFGKAELWIKIFEQSDTVDIAEYSLSLNGEQLDYDLKLFSEGTNEIDYNNNQNNPNIVELSFIVDATSSMRDELKFLKDDLQDVIQRVEQEDSSVDIYTSSIFYRDEGDDYVVKGSEFTNDLDETIDFIDKQKASGGGDYPEAVHSGLKAAIEELTWSENARTRIAFLLLDAPPHYEPEVIEQLQNSIAEASRKGIKIIPITASGINKQTEFLMRFMSVSTNSTYVFITDDSGIGNEHLEASVGEHEIEYLNDLMVRLIKEYSEI